MSGNQVVEGCRHRGLPIDGILDSFSESELGCQKRRKLPIPANLALGEMELLEVVLGSGDELVRRFGGGGANLRSRHFQLLVVSYFIHVDYKW